MKKPKKCPRCGALSDEINNAFEMSKVMGITRDGSIKKWMCGKCDYFFDDDEAELEAWYDGKDFSKMTLSQIADVIISDWGDEISPAASPYVDAMSNLENINDIYGSDPASSVVAYFLTNAKDWKTETAKKVKGVLQKMLTDYEKNR